MLTCAIWVLAVSNQGHEDPREKVPMDQFHPTKTKPKMPGKMYTLPASICM